MHSKLITDMFYLGLPWLKKIIRPILVHAFLIAGHGAFTGNKSPRI